MKNGKKRNFRHLTDEAIDEVVGRLFHIDICRNANCTNTSRFFQFHDGVCSACLSVSIPQKSEKTAAVSRFERQEVRDYGAFS